MEVNVDSIFLLCREALEPMKASGEGRVVNLSSNVITFGMSDLMHYVASQGSGVGDDPQPRPGRWAPSGSR